MLRAAPIFASPLIRSAASILLRPPAERCRPRALPRSRSASSASSSSTCLRILQLALPASFSACGRALDLGFFQHFGRVLEFRFRGSCHSLGVSTSDSPSRSSVSAAADSAAAPSAPPRSAAFFALFKVAEVVANRDADALQRLLADARNLFELLRRHVRQRSRPW